MTLPTIVIFDGSVAVTGALVAARRQAEALAGIARIVLVLPRAATIEPAFLEPFARVERITLVPARVRPLSLLLYGPGTLTTAFSLVRLLRRERCNRLQINDFYLLPGHLVRWFGFRGRIITWVRIDPLRFGRPGRVWLRFAIAASDRIVAVSRFIRDLLPPRFDPTVIYDPAPNLQPRPDGRTATRFLCVANYIDGKGQREAIAAFARIAGHYPAAELHFAGGDMGLAKNRAYLAELERLARASGAADRIIFHDFTPDVGQFLATGFAALMLSHSESFSQTTVEAAAAGLPVIATRCGGPEEIVVDGRTGFLVAVGDVEATAERMRRLLDDCALAEQMGRDARTAVVERFSVEQFRAELIALFDLA